MIKQQCQVYRPLVYRLILLSPHVCIYFFFFFNDTATTEIYTLSLHDALPISSEALEHDELRGNPRVRTAVAHPGGGVRLCIMRRPPEGTKSRHAPSSSARRCDANESGERLDGGSRSRRRG